MSDKGLGSEPVQTLNSYDALPYDRLPLPETEPDFLAALARLHAFEGADAEASRVLELGCAQGGNLIPMAARYPESSFVGVDLSRVQIEEGQAFIERAGLENIRLLHGDIAALPEQLGQFDFIIAHGVYSWVPDEVREALLAACRRLLTPRGIAYISFNVEAGWRLYGKIRDALLARDNPALGPLQRVAFAREALANMSSGDERLDKEIAFLGTASPSYLFHEYLSDINQAFSFAAFLQALTRHGLRYLGEAGPRRARVVLENDRGLSAEARYERWLEAEGRLDESLQTRFRRALLVRDDAALPEPQNAERLKSLAFSADLGSDEELDFAGSDTQYFQSPTGERYPVAHPLLKAFLVVLASANPDQLNYRTAIAHALPLAREYGYAGEADQGFLDALLDAVQLQAVRVHTRARALAAPDGLLRLRSLAQAQAQAEGWPVSTCAHQALDLDEWGRWIISRMDGSVSTEDLARQLVGRLAESGIQATPQQALQAVESYAALFRQHGIVV